MDAQSRVHQLARDVYYWAGDLSKHEQTNVGFVVFRDYVLVIDANFPWAAEHILADIKTITSKPVRFGLETDHPMAHHTMEEIVPSPMAAARRSTQSQLALELGTKGMEDIREQTRMRMDHLELPSIRFPDRLAFDDGQHRVELIKYGQAHTKGDGVAYLPAEGVVFVGDLAVNWTHGNNVPPGCSLHRLDSRSRQDCPASRQDRGSGAWRPGRCGPPAPPPARFYCRHVEPGQARSQG